METLNFLDPKQRRRQSATLLIGYALVGCAILLMATILLFVAYGFGFKNGQVIQNGLVFISSTPHPAQVYIDGKRYKNDTNTRIILPAGMYNFMLKRTGYRTWSRAIGVTGGQVESYVYPFLLPNSLTSITRQTYAKAPSLLGQSLDRRWLMVARPNTESSFDIYDLNNPMQAPTIADLPAGVLSAATASHSLQTIAWAGDNTHALLAHLYDGKTEYVLFDRTNPAQSLNLTHTLSLPTSGIDLRLSNEKYDQYVWLDATQHTVYRATLSTPQASVYMTNVLAYTTYGAGTMLYATPDTGDHSKVDIDLFENGTPYTIRRAAANTTYLLGLSSYNGSLYAAISASSENEGYVYQDPAAEIANQHLGVAVPAEVFTIHAPTYVGFSANGQYIDFEQSNNFAVYDAESQSSFLYSVPVSVDAPQTHAVWMDAARLTYVHNGQLVMFDYDGQNRQTLVSADSMYSPYFDPNYKFLYTFVPSASNKANELLTATSLRTSADQ